MSSQKYSKRSYSDSESYTETQPLSFPHSIVLKSIEDKAFLQKLNPLVNEETLSELHIS